MEMMEQDKRVIFNTETNEKGKYSWKSTKKTIVNFYDCFLRVYAYNIINKVGKDAFIMRETRILEFKETITNTFLTISSKNSPILLGGWDELQRKNLLLQRK